MPLGGGIVSFHAPGPRARRTAQSPSLTFVEGPEGKWTTVGEAHRFERDGYGLPSMGRAGARFRVTSIVVLVRPD